MNQEKHIEELTTLFHEINYEPKDLKIFFEGLTHSSYLYVDSFAKTYQRLEFLGDSVIHLLVTNYIFKNSPHLNEGEMTIIRATAISTSLLAEIARELNLFKVAFVGPSMKNTNYSEKFLADLFEAFVGALYIDSSTKKLSTIQISRQLFNFFQNYVFPKIDKLLLSNNKNPKTILQEFLQVEKTVGIEYKIKQQKNVFEAEIVLEKQLLGKGEGKTKKAAEINAANDALQKLNVDYK